jgi:hypothetical protein
MQFYIKLKKKFKIGGIRIYFDFFDYLDTTLKFYSFKNIKNKNTFCGI